MGLTSVVAAVVATTLLVGLPPPDGRSVDADARAVVMVGLTGTSLDAGTRAHLARGGRSVILFAPNVGDRTELRELTAAIACAASGQAIVAVDEEPGPVGRLGSLITALPSMGDLAAMDAPSIEAAAAASGTELRTLGVTMALAPVVDVDRGSPALRGRALATADDAARVGAAWARALAAARVGSSAKHFPGLGAASVDPHLAATPVEVDADTLREVDLVPFAAAIDAGVSSVMVGHGTYAAFDGDLPASLSPTAYALLRDLGFDGVALTDALGMRAITHRMTVSEAAVAAITAGADQVIVEDPALREDVVASLRRAVRAGALPAERLAEAASRVRDLAARVGIGCPSPASRPD